MVSGIIISKTLLSINDPTEGLINSLYTGRIKDIVFLYPAHGQMFTGFPRFPGVKAISVPDPHSLGAISDGMSACEQKDLHGVMILPSDASGVNQSLIASLLHLFWTSRRRIVMACREGEPDISIIAAAIFPEIQDSVPASSFSDFLDRHSSDVLKVRFDARGVMLHDSFTAAIFPLHAEEK